MIKVIYSWKRIWCRLASLWRHGLDEVSLIDPLRARRLVSTFFLILNMKIRVLNAYESKNIRRVSVEKDDDYVQIEDDDPRGLRALEFLLV